MSGAIETLQEKIRHIQQELDAVKTALEQLSGSSTLPAPANQGHRRALTGSLRRLGIEPREPIGAIRLQERMRQDGLQPEQNVLSRGIVEMREE